ncbi:MAG: peptidoglycan-binding protein [Epsilonproteobacteria bacterium]|nr:peptidoglycan-binding protein [Campylobacterota bacterium]
MVKIKKLCVVSVGLLTLGGFAQASMMDQLIYNVAGQATNAAGARLGDEIYYGSSRSATPSHHVKHKKHYKKRHVAHVDTDEMKIQRALASLGFYRGRIDGAINSFETRSAIKDLNVAYGISTGASLLPQEKNSLIYLGTLFDFDRHLISRGTDKRSKGKKIQTALKIHGFYFSKIDGAVGPGTRRSISEYKASKGLSYGNALDFEEEYQLVSSAKAMNDKNIEETIGFSQSTRKTTSATGSANATCTTAANGSSNYTSSCSSTTTSTASSASNYTSSSACSIT